jgi:uncharacterized tellurite resistance protein B-like protein
MADAAARRKFEAMVAAAFADGFLADAEKDVLQRKAEKLQISNREMHEIIGLGQQRKLSIGIPSTTAEREALLEDLIDVAVADGRVEAPEYSILARFAETLKISLPDLRIRVNRRMQGLSDRNTRVEPRRETVRSEPRRPAPAPAPASAPAPAPAQQAMSFEAVQFSQPPTPTVQASAASSDAKFPHQPKVADLPPVTLQLLKQSMMFDNEADSILNISRTLGISAEKAAEIRLAILTAFPDLKPGAAGARNIRR